MKQRKVKTRTKLHKILTKNYLHSGKGNNR